MTTGKRAILSALVGVPLAVGVILIMLLNQPGRMAVTARRPSSHHYRVKILIDSSVRTIDSEMTTEVAKSIGQSFLYDLTIVKRAVQRKNLVELREAVIGPAMDDLTAMLQSGASDPSWAWLRSHRLQRLEVVVVRDSFQASPHVGIRMHFGDIVEAPVYSLWKDADQYKIFARGQVVV